MKGYRTLILNGLLALGAALAHYVLGADLSAVKPEVATVIVAVANIGLRLITTTPVGKSK